MTHFVGEVIVKIEASDKFEEGDRTDEAITFTLKLNPEKMA
jgi:hypothetical protein